MYYIFVNNHVISQGEGKARGCLEAGGEHVMWGQIDTKIQNFGLNLSSFPPCMSNWLTTHGYSAIIIMHSNLLKMGQPTSNLAVETITVLCV